MTEPNRETLNAYENGFYTGLNWPDAWMDHKKPGGPWFPSSGPSREQAVAENKAWREGWEVGLAEKITTGRINPKSNPDENGRYHVIYG